MARLGKAKSVTVSKPKRRFYQSEVGEKPQPGPYDGLSDMLPNGYNRTAGPELARGVAPARRRRIR